MGLFKTMGMHEPSNSETLKPQGWQGKRCAMALALVAAGIGVLSLVVGMIKPEFFSASFGSRWVSDAGVGLFFCGTGLAWALTHPARRRIPFIAGVLTALWGVVGVAEHLSHQEFFFGALDGGESGWLIARISMRGGIALVCLGLVLAWQHGLKFAPSPRVLRFLTAGAAALGAIDLYASTLWMDAWVQAHQMQAMSCSTALGVLALSLGFRALWRPGVSDDEVRDARRRMGWRFGYALGVVLLIALTSTAWILSTQSRKAFDEQVQVNLNARALLYETYLRNHSFALNAAAQEISFYNAAQRETESATQGLQTILNRLLLSGYTGLRVERQRQSLAQSGVFTQDPAWSIPLRTPEQATLLSKHGKLLLQVRTSVGLGGGETGLLIAERPLPLLEMMAEATSIGGSEGTFVLCAQQSGQLICLPSGIAQAERLPMWRAISGESGTEWVHASHGPHQLFAYRPVSDLGLVIALRHASSQVFFGLHQYFLIWIPVWIAVVAAAIALVQAQVGPLLERLAQAKERMRADHQALILQAQALQDAESRLRQVADHVPGLIAYVDRDERFRFANEAHRTINGRPASELIGKHLQTVMGDGPYFRARYYVQKALEGNEAAFETDFGTMRHVFQVVLKPDIAPQGGVRGFYSMSLDITQRKQAEQRLIESEQQLRTITDHVPAFIAYVDQNQRYRFLNQAYTTLTGRPIDELIGSRWEELGVTPLYESIEHYLDMVEAGETASFQATFKSRGRVLHLLMTLVPDAKQEEGRRGFYSLGTDITALKETESALAVSERRLRLMADNLSVLIGYLDTKQRFIFGSNGYRQAYGVKGDLVGKTAQSVLGSLAYRQSLPHIEAVLNGTSERFERLVYREGKPRYELVEYVPDLDESGKVCGFFSLAHDVTAYRLLAQVLAASERRLRTIADNMPALIAYLDEERKLRFSNKAYESWLGRSADEIDGRSADEVYGEEIYPLIEPYLSRAFSGERVEYEVELSHRSAWHWVKGVFVPDLDSRNRVLGVYAMTHNVTDSKTVEIRLHTQAFVDVLTGLPNRRQFTAKLDEALHNQRIFGRGLAVMLLDIDYFKTINDTYGHEGGDEVLKEFAIRLKDSVRAEDTVARLAGDEFVVILEGLNRPSQAGEVAEKILAALQTPFQLRDHALKVTSSLGVALHSDELDDRELLRRADEALYAAKEAGRNGYRVAGLK